VIVHRVCDLVRGSKQINVSKLD